jgi:uncharacterized protein with ATP-grasp and redox domains
LNQVLRAADYLGLSEEQKDRLFQESLKKAAELPYKEMTAPEYSEHIYKIVAAVSGEPDPYKTLRHEQNRMVLDKIDAIREKISSAPDPLLAAGYYALLGNIIDYGGVRIFDAEEIFNQNHAMDISITVNDYPGFRKRLRGAKRLLILADNAGEAVFDLVFIEEMKRFNPDLEVFYGVRSAPAINDVIKEDAEFIGIHNAAHILETGAVCAGTVVDKGTEEFKRVYFSSDIIISKGQGNFETLEDRPEDILFIFKVKCDVVAKHVNLDLNSLVLAFKSSF